VGTRGKRNFKGISLFQKATKGSICGKPKVLKGIPKKGGKTLKGGKGAYSFYKKEEIGGFQLLIRYLRGVKVFLLRRAGRTSSCLQGGGKRHSFYPRKKRVMGRKSKEFKRGNSKESGGVGC